MTRKRKSALGVGVALAMVAGLLLVMAAPALAAAPPWEPDTNSASPYGQIVLYDAAGNVLTGGNNLSHIADYAVATTGADAGATKANLLFARPDHTQPTTALWTTGSASASTNFPNSAAPAPITGPGFTNPVVTLGATDGNISSFIASITPDTTAGYANIYQLRLKDTGTGGAGSGAHYWDADIMVDTTAGTWTLVYPSVTTTTTSITTNPANGGSAVTGSNVTLQATVSPGENGTIQFFDGTTAVGSAHAVTTGSPTANDTATSPAIGSHSYTAVFTPTGGTLVQGSTSPTSTVNITPPQTGTSTALSANPSTQAQYQPVVLTANITEADAPTTTGLAGSVQFFDGASSLGTQNTNDGTAGEYKLTVSTLTQGTHSTIHAVFTPTSSAYAQSTSPNITVTITAPTCPGAPDPSGATCTDTQSIQVTVNPGSLTITTPYTATNPFVLPAMTLNSAGTLLSSGPTRFPAASDPQIVVHSSLAGDPNWTVSVSATDLVSGTNTINGSGLGLTGGTLNATPVFPGTVTFTDNAARDPNNPGTNHGIKGGPYTFAQSSGGGNGSAAMFGMLTLLAPTSTQPGTYTGTITFTVA